jgi:hypothetical protein
MARPKKNKKLKKLKVGTKGSTVPEKRPKVLEHLFLQLSVAQRVTPVSSMDDSRPLGVSPLLSSKKMFQNPNSRSKKAIAGQ